MVSNKKILKRIIHRYLNGGVLFIEFPEIYYFYDRNKNEAAAISTMLHRIYFVDSFVMNICDIMGVFYDEELGFDILNILFEYIRDNVNIPEYPLNEFDEPTFKKEGTSFSYRLEYCNRLDNGCSYMRI